MGMRGPPELGGLQGQGGAGCQPWWGRGHCSPDSGSRHGQHHLPLGARPPVCLSAK